MEMLISTAGAIRPGSPSLQLCSRVTEGGIQSGSRPAGCCFCLRNAIPPRRRQLRATNSPSPTHHQRLMGFRYFPGRAEAVGRRDARVRIPPSLFSPLLYPPLKIKQRFGELRTKQKCFYGFFFNLFVLKWAYSLCVY